MSGFTEVVVYLSDPLVLSGFAIFIVIGFMKYIISRNLFPQIAKRHAYNVIMRLSTYGFILALVIIFGGLILAYTKETSSENKVINGNLLNSDNLTNMSKRLRDTPVNTNVEKIYVSRVVEYFSKKQSERKIFDITIENNTSNQYVLNQWLSEWEYLSGVLSSINKAEVIEPILTESITVNLNTNESSSININSPLMKTVVVPSGLQKPSVTVLRLEIIYKLKGKALYHPTVDWNILFNLRINTSSGVVIPVLEKSYWRI